MHSLTQWEQTPTFDPLNPNQIVREPNNTYPGQGGYSSLYWNKQPTTVGQVLGGMTFAGLPAWSQALIVGSLAAVGGWYAMKYVGPRVGLSGPKRRCVQWGTAHGNRRCRRWA
jgi:hypothetical protein